MRLISLPRLAFIALFLFVCGCSHALQRNGNAMRWARCEESDCLELADAESDGEEMVLE